MKETFARELQALADRCGEDLASKRTMVERWLGEFGTQADDVIVQAFELLRDPERIARGHRFPGYYEIAGAFKSARNLVRAKSEPKHSRNQGGVLPLGTITALVGYASLNRRHMDQDQLEQHLTSFIAQGLSARDIEEHGRLSPGGKAKALEEQREKQRKAAVAARLREIDENTTAGLTAEQTER